MFLRQQRTLVQSLRAVNPLMSFTSVQLRGISKHLKAFATIDPANLSTSDKGFNLVQGEWTSPSQYIDLVDPLNGDKMIKIPDTQMDEISPFVESL